MKGARSLPATRGEPPLPRAAPDLERLTGAQMDGLQFAVYPSRLRGGCAALVYGTGGAAVATAYLFALAGAAGFASPVVPIGAGPWLGYLVLLPLSGLGMLLVARDGWRRAVDPSPRLVIDRGGLWVRADASDPAGEMTRIGWDSVREPSLGRLGDREYLRLGELLLFLDGLAASRARLLAVVRQFKAYHSRAPGGPPGDDGPGGAFDSGSAPIPLIRIP